MANYFDQFDETKPAAKQSANYFDQFDHTAEAAQAAPQSTNNSWFTPEFNQADTLGKIKMLAGGVGTGLAETGRAIAQLPNDVANTGVAIGHAIAPESITRDVQTNPVDIYGADLASLPPEITAALRPQTEQGRTIETVLPWLTGGGEIKAGVEAAPFALRAAKAFGAGTVRALPETAAATAINMQQNNEAFTPENYEKSLGLNMLLSGGANAIGESLAAGARTLKNTIPEWLGASRAERIAEAVSPEEIERMYQGGNAERQAAYRTATTDEAGNLITPSSTLYGPGGEIFRQDERRGLSLGNELLARRQAAARSGESLNRAIDEMAGPNPQSAQEAIQEATAAFKKQKNDLYQDTLTKAQQVIDDLKVNNFEMKMSSTKDYADQFLKEDADLKAMPTSATNLLNKIKNQKFTSLKEVDFFKQKLSNEANKAYRAGDMDTYGALTNIKGQLKHEADLTIRRIDPEAGKLYDKADKYFSEFVDDFGSKSQAGKVGANESEARATNALLANSDVARERTANIAQALKDAINSGDFEGAANLAKNFAESMGSTSRLTSRDYARLRGNVAEAGITGAGDQTFQKTLRSELAKDLPQMESVSGLGGGDQAAANQLLIDASKSLEGQEVKPNSISAKLLNWVGKKVAGGFPIGDVITDPFNTLASKTKMTTINDFANRRFLTNLDNLENLRNISRKIQDGTYQSDSALVDLIELVNPSIRAGMLHDNEQGPAVATGSEQPLLNTFGDTTPQAEPEQHAQAAKKPTEPQEKFDPGITNLYHAFSDAETGSEADPYIRTKAAEGGKPSSAFGPAQITRDLMKDYLSNHGDELTDSQKDYAKRFIEQGNKFLKAKASDPKYGYGKSGDLNSPEDKAMYDVVAQKILKSIVERNGNSLNKTVKSWRGKNDAAYARKVRNSFVKRQGWTA
ncbi:hypothetical protein [Escherichia coli]|uniref:hypothetical protein n=1 Tax=Escherichia coli TaxID=562 RepID=UPI0038B2C265